MNKGDYPLLQLKTNLSKGTHNACIDVVHFTVIVGSSTMIKTHTLK